LARPQEHPAHGQVYRACARSVQGFLAMTEERVRAGPETGFLAHKTPRVASDSPLPGKNESMRPWRLLEGLRKIPARFGVNPGVGSGSAALSSRQASSPSSPSRCKAAYSGSGPV
jgi:hypothetical protein